MTCLKELIGNILVNVLAYHQKVITHPCFGLIFFQRFKDNIRFQFAKRLSTIVILAGIISGSNNKTIEIPEESNASFVVFSSVLANEN
jgi:hypothetical protein